MAWNLITFLVPFGWLWAWVISADPNGYTPERAWTGLIGGAGLLAVILIVRFFVGAY